MRTTITLEPDVAALVERRMKETGASFKTVVNDLLRDGLAPKTRTSFEMPTFDLGPARVDLSRPHTVLAEFDAEEFTRKRELGK